MLTLMNHLARTAVAAMLLAAWSVPAASQSLNQALDAAWQRHPQAAALSARQAEAQARTELAAGFSPAPASVSLGQKTDRLNSNAGMREWELELAAPLWLPGQRAARQTEAQRAAHELDARTAYLRWQLAGEVREAWWALAAARGALTLARQRLDTAEALAAAVQRRFAAGDLARVDANLAQGERLAAQGEVLDADKALRQAEQSYRNLTGAAAPATLPGESTESTESPTSPRSSVAAGPADDAALVPQHPHLQALRASSELAGSRVALVDASRREAPELALRWISERSEATRPHERSVGIKLTLPLSSSGRVSQESASARAELAQAETELSLASIRIEQDIANARAEFEATEHQLRMARERQTLAADSLMLAQRSFDLGESDLPALMRARADALDTSANLHRQQLMRELALSRLHQAQGVLP